MSPYALGVTYSVITGVCWAILAIGLKYALHFTSTGTIVWVRMVFAFLLLLICYAIVDYKKIIKVFRHPPLKIIIAGIALAMNYYGYMKGLELTSASNAQIMIQLGPLSLLFVGVWYFKEELFPIQWFGIGIAITGFIFFNWDQIQVALEKSDIYILGNVWIIFAAITWTIFAALQKYQFSKGWSPQMINLLVYGICCICLLPMANLSELTPLNFHQWFILFLLGLNTLIAYGAFGEALKLVPTSHVSLIISANPLLTILFVGLIAHFEFTFISPEPILWKGYLGAFLVVLGVAIAVSFKKVKRRKT